MRRTLAALVAAVLVAPLLAAGEAAEPDCAVSEPGNPGWGSVRPLPPNRDDRMISSGGEDYVGFAVGRRQGTQAVVVDTRVLQVTADAGCTWADALAFGDEFDLQGDVNPATARFVGVATSDRAEGDERIVALVFDLEVVGEARVRTAVSDDGGATWEMGGRGLPDALALPQAFDDCGPRLGCEVLVAPSDPDVVYVSVTGSFDTLLFRSADGGLSFEQVNDRVGALPFTESEGTAMAEVIAVDWTQPDTLWADSFRSIVSSTNGGRSWRSHDLRDVVPDARDTAAVAVAPPSAHGEGEVVAIVEDGAGQEWTVHSDDRGVSFTAFPVDWKGTLVDLTAGPEPGLFVATTDRGAWTLDLAERKWIKLGGSSLGPLSDPHALAGSETVWFRGPATLPVTGDLAFVPPPMPPDVDLGIEVPPFDPLDPRGNLPGRFRFDDAPIHLAVGQSTEVDLLFDLPLNRTPLDVFFLFDQSGSMQEEMDALARSMNRIANELIRRRVDIWVGLGGYSGGWRYQLHRDIGPPDREFQRKLESLRAGGGAETAYTALHQVATGTGLPDSQAGFGPQPGWNAHWRPGAVRVVVNLTDEELQVEPEGPTVDETIEALQQQRIKVIGLVSAASVGVDEGTFDQDDPGSFDSAVETDDYTFGSVAVMAKKTRALAGPSGVDCGGDGEVDIPPTGPIACYVTPLSTLEQAEDVELIGSLADVMVEILDGVTEVHDIEFHVDEFGVLREVDPMLAPGLDIRDPQQVELTATVACAPPHAGKVHTPIITAVANARHLAAANLVVACGPIALGGPPPPAVPPAPAPPPPAAVAAAPAPPPPAPVQAPAPAQGLANAANPATAQALTPQVGVAAAAQKQQQVRTAGLGPAQPRLPQESGELAYSAVRSRGQDPGPAVVLAGAVLASMAGAVALRRRDQPAGRPGRVGLR